MQEGEDMQGLDLHSLQDRWAPLTIIHSNHRGASATLSSTNSLSFTSTIHPFTHRICRSHLANSSRRVSLDTLCRHLIFTSCNPQPCIRQIWIWMVMVMMMVMVLTIFWQPGRHHQDGQTGHFKEWRCYQMGLGRKQWKANQPTELYHFVQSNRQFTLHFLALGYFYGMWHWIVKN